MVVRRILHLFVWRLGQIGLPLWILIVFLTAGETVLLLKNRGSERAFRSFLWSVFFTCLLFVLSATVFARKAVPPDYSKISFDITTAWTRGPGIYGMVDTVIELVMNILMFVPFGLLLMKLTKRAWKALGVSLLITLSIETLQLATGRGFFELADILLNCLGAAAGCGIYKTVRSIRKNSSDTGMSLMPAVEFTDMDLFIKILSDHLNKRQTAALENVNWEELTAIANKHDLSALLYFQCKDYLPKEYLPVLEQFHMSAAYWYFNRQEEEQGIREIIGNIRFFFIKGSAVAAFYPQPYLRTMGDSDIVVDESDMEKVNEIMIREGWECISIGHYSKNGLQLEVHPILAYKTAINTPDVVSFFNGFWNYYQDGVIDWSFHFLFVLFHLRSHLFGGGVGLRQFADVAVLTKYNSELEWEWITFVLKELDMWSWSQKVFALNRYWFRIEPPVEIEEADEDFLAAATYQILNNGVFGSGDLDNRANRIAVNNPNSRIPILVMLKRVMGFIFPRYKHLIRMPQYAFLKGRPYLLPASWIYRSIYTIHHRGLNVAKRTIKTSFTTRKAIDERKALFEKWGLKGSGEK